MKNIPFCPLYQLMMIPSRSIPLLSSICLSSFHLYFKAYFHPFLSTCWAQLPPVVFSLNLVHLLWSVLHQDVSKSFVHISLASHEIKSLYGQGYCIYLWIPLEYLSDFLTCNSYSVNVKFERILKELLAVKYLFIT